MLKVCAVLPCECYNTGTSTYVIKAEVGSSDNGSLMHEQGSVENKPETGESGSSEVCEYMYSIRASVDALCRDGTSEISRDPRTKRLQTRRESLAMPSKHTDNNF